MVSGRRRAGDGAVVASGRGRAGDGAVVAHGRVRPGDCVVVAPGRGRAGDGAVVAHGRGRHGNGTGARVVGRDRRVLDHGSQQDTGSYPPGRIRTDTGDHNSPEQGIRYSFRRTKLHLPFTINIVK